MGFEVDHILEPGETVLDAVAGLPAGTFQRKLFVLTDRHVYIARMKTMKRKAGDLEEKLSLAQGFTCRASGRTLHVGQHSAQFGLFELGKIRQFVALAEQAQGAARVAAEMPTGQVPPPPS
jgi:hypothetical protein